jgi:hypothetical protein
MPVLHRCVDGEKAHQMSVWMAKHKLLPAASFRRKFDTSLVSSFKTLHPQI